MMNRISAGISILLVFFGALFSNAQIPDTGCEARAFMYSEAFAMHLQNNDLVKLAVVLREWELDCGFNEPVFRAKTLYLVLTGDFPGPLLQQDLLDQAIAFEIRHSLIENEDAATREEYFAVYRQYFGYVPVNETFDRRTLQKARELLPQASQNELSHAFLTLYAGNTREFFLMLKDGRYSSSPLYEQYSARLVSLRRKPEFNFGISTGLWIPRGDLSIIGYKPSIGVFAGVTRFSTSVNAVFDLRFGRTASPVSILIRDSLVQTDIHHGSYLGLEGVQILWRNRHVRTGIFISAGYNIIDIVEEALLIPERQTFGSWAFMAGPFVDMVFRNKTRIGIHPGFMLLNHQQNRGSSLEGNAITFKLVFGYSENARKYVNLRRMGY
jgi:hypothetical protein